MSRAVGFLAWLIHAIAVSRAWGVLARVILALALILVVGWPAMATVLEATQAVPKVEGAMRRAGWSAAADSLVRWRGVEPGEEEGDVGAAMDPAGTADLLRETRGLSRPARLAMETIGLVLATEAIALPIGVLLAIVLFRTDIWGRRGLLAIIALAAFVPIPLHATAWLGALGNAGRMQALGVRPILVGRFGAAVVHAIAALPWVVLLTGVGLCAVEPELEESALLEFGPLRVLMRITLRRAIGAIAAAALAVAVLTAGDMTVTDLLQVRTYAEEAYVQFVLGRGLADAAVVALPPLIVLGIGIILAGRALSRLDPARLASAASGARTFRLGRWRLPAGVLLTLLVWDALAFPLYSMIWCAGRVGGHAALGQPPVWSLSGLAGTLRFAAAEIRDPLLASLFWASMAATLATAMAFGLAWASRRSRPWRWTMLGAMALALATPGPVAGRALVLAYRDLPALYDSSTIIVVAQALRLAVRPADPLAVPPLLPPGLPRRRRARRLRAGGSDAPRRVAAIGPGTAGGLDGLAGAGPGRAAGHAPGLSGGDRAHAGVPLGAVAHRRREPPLGRRADHARGDRRGGIGGRRGDRMVARPGTRVSAVHGRGAASDLRKLSTASRWPGFRSK